jgi:hypothetical protein
VVARAEIPSRLASGGQAAASRTPEHVGILQVRLRVTLLSSDELRELGRVTQEENRGVVLHGSAAATVSLSFESTCPSEIETHVDMVPVALLGPELDGETARVACRVGRSTLATDSRETSSGAGLVSDLAEELGAGEIGDVVGDLKDAVRSASLGVDNTLPADAIRQYPVAIADPLLPPDHPTYGMRSRSKCESRSIRWKSWRRSGPFGPAR